MRIFGASANYQDLYQHFGITAEAVTAAAQRLLASSKILEHEADYEVRDSRPVAQEFLDG